MCWNELSRAVYVARARCRAAPFASWLLLFSLNLRLRIDRVTCRSLIWAGPELTPPSLTAEPSQALEWNIYGMRRRPGPSGLQPSPKGNNINKQKRKCFVNLFLLHSQPAKGDRSVTGPRSSGLHLKFAIFARCSDELQVKRI